MPSPDLWSSGVWDLVQTWARRTISVLWSLSIPHPGEQGVKLSDVSVLVTVVSCSRLPTSCRTGGLHIGEWVLVWAKVLWNLHEASLSHSRGDRWNLFSLLFWPSQFLWKRSKVLAGGVQLSPYLAIRSFLTVLRAESYDSNGIFIR